MTDAATQQDSVEYLRRRSEQLAQLQAISDAALAHLGLAELLAELLTRVRQMLTVDTVAVLLLEPDGHTLAARAASGLEEEVEQGFRIPVGAGFAGRIAAERRAVIIDKVDHSNVLNPLLREKGVRSLLGVPLLVHGRVIGVLHVGSLTPRRFTAENAELLQLAADRAALAIEHARLFAAERAARETAEAANRAKDEFLSIVSHELRTPLTALLGWAQMLRSGRLPAASLLRAYEVIERSAQTQRRLVEDVLDVSRITTGRLRLDVQLVSLAPLVEEAVETFRVAAQAKGIAVQVSVEPGATLVRADPLRIVQVVSNLLGNALKFTPGGGRIGVTVRREERHVLVEVSDTGSGIDPTFLPSIFERFRQADSSSTRLHGGLGLGLAIVKHLVDLHGGSVEASSAGPGQGATFTVRLPIAVLEPLAPAELVRSTLGGELDAPSLAGVRVLVLDDDDATREMLATVLTNYGAAVTTASAVAEALAALERESISVVLADLAMPDEDGFTFISRLRSREAEHGGEIPAVALTAFTEQEIRSLALAAGFQVHLPKPVEVHDVVTTVARLAGRTSASPSAAD